MKRRRSLALLAVAALSPWLPRLAVSPAAAAPTPGPWARLLPHSSFAARLGAAADRAFHAVEPAELLHMACGIPHDGEVIELAELKRALAAAIRADYAALRLVRVDGWLLSRAEAAAIALSWRARESARAAAFGVIG